MNEGNFVPNGNGTPMVQPQKKKLKTWQIVLIVLIVLVAIVIIGGILGGGSENGPTKVSDADSMASGEVSDVAKDTFSVGETVKLKNLELTVTKVEKSAGKDYFKPKEGMEYVVVTVKYRNIGDRDTISYNSYDFDMQNSKGQITDPTIFTIDGDTALGSGNLAPGGEIEGTIAWEQPIDDPSLVLHYTGNIFLTNSKINFKLN